MTVLGSWPADRYSTSWMTQRIANRAPEYTHLRHWPFSIGQQLLNPIGRDIQKTIQQLYEERYNIFLSSTNIDLIDRLYRVDLDEGMSFTQIDTPDNAELYSTPTVYATIDDVEYQITVAKNNDIQTLWYEALPSRIEYAEELYDYDEVIPRTQIGSLDSITPYSLPIDGHLYVTIRNNTTWSYRAPIKIYYPKVYVTGVTRKGTSTTEAIPIQYNGTFKTINQWQSVESVFVSYMDDTAQLTLEVLPFDQETILDTRNLFVSSNGVEAKRFMRLGEQNWGSTLVAEGFTTNDIEVIQLGIDTKETEYEIELLDSSGNNIDALGMALKPNTDYAFVIDETKLYIYNTNLPYPDMQSLSANSPDTKMDLYSDRWTYPRGSTATVTTDTLDVSNPPWKFRWTLEEPDGTTSYLRSDGSKLPTTFDAWLDNLRWEEGYWDERNMDVLLNKLGTYVLTIECLYSDITSPGKSFTRTTRFLLYVPAIRPEVTLDLPTIFQSSENLMFDSDGGLWLLKTDAIRKLNVYYDYFIVDYERNAVLLRENYTSVRVAI